MVPSARLKMYQPPSVALVPRSTVVTLSRIQSPAAGSAISAISTDRSLSAVALVNRLTLGAPLS
jgi:hypothetical protein